ncbi:hypothetical protein [Phenylobacterium sp.]|uniref:hypothetical protein n=1 Tax=Phenylobacterium sp. TaxID=1871053 RepID=UPI002732DA8C|nr:hypothetical protein [Phenylobacterium sp.]MDP3659755.1 hypothetical protein [Phenylobacterium sp.]
MPSVSLLSPLSRGECVQRLREAVDAPLVLFGKKSVVGDVDDERAVLRKRLRYRNSFQTRLRVTLEDAAPGTRMQCRSGAHPAALVFITLWLGIVTVIGGAVFLAALVDLTGAAQSEIPPAIGLLAPPGFLLFGITLVAVGRSMARGEADFLIDFVAQQTKARRVEAAPATSARAATVT